jgi:hypothetical protein
VNLQELQDYCARALHRDDMASDVQPALELALSRIAGLNLPQLVEMGPVTFTGGWAPTPARWHRWHAVYDAFGRELREVLGAVAVTEIRGGRGPRWRRSIGQQLYVYPAPADGSVLQAAWYAIPVAPTAPTASIPVMDAFPGLVAAGTLVELHRITRNAAELERWDGTYQVYADVATRTAASRLLAGAR